MKQKSLHREESKGAEFWGAPPSFHLTTKHPYGPYIHQKKVRRKTHKLTTTIEHLKDSAI